MMNYLTTSNSRAYITHYGHANDEWIGSNKYKVIDNVLFEKNNKQKEIKLDLKSEQKPKNKRLYKLNKKKVREKAIALLNTRESKLFCAFYTITFPCGIHDDVAYKLFNIWLTRCRTRLAMDTYLWVAERQKNGTIHFHILTNTYMDIRAVNGYMKKSLINVNRRLQLNLPEEILNRYNGVDVDNILYSKRRKGRYYVTSRNQTIRRISKYLTKYIIKNNEKSDRLMYHCSTIVSNLITKHKQYIDTDINNYEKELAAKKLHLIHANDYCTYISGKDITVLHDSYTEQSINEAIIDIIRSKCARR